MDDRPLAGELADELAKRDRRLMKAAVRLSLRHVGLTGDNPSVGALIVREGADGTPLIVGRGVTAPGGRPHAELMALREAGDAARGATAYATLEPCSHIGKAPPCADALVAAGVRRVVVATLDPDPRVAGRGVDILRKAGIEVAVGPGAAEARRAMEGFLALRGRGRPFLTLKLAVSADGMIGRPGAGQVAITGPEARRAVQAMRMAHEAILVGVGTVLEDDPRLDVRLPGLETRSPHRVIVDPFARTPPAAKAIAGAGSATVLVSEKAPPARVDALRAAGAELRSLASDYRGRFDPREILRILGVLGLKSVLLEGGAETAHLFLATGLADRICLFAAPTVVGQGGIASPLTAATLPRGYVESGAETYGADRLLEFERSP